MWTSDIENFETIINYYVQDLFQRLSQEEIKVLKGNLKAKPMQLMGSHRRQPDQLLLSEKQAVVIATDHEIRLVFTARKQARMPIAIKTLTSLFNTAANMTHFAGPERQLETVHQLFMTAINYAKLDSLKIGLQTPLDTLGGVSVLSEMVTEIVNLYELDDPNADHARLSAQEIRHCCAHYLLRKGDNFSVSAKGKKTKTLDRDALLRELTLWTKDPFKQHAVSGCGCTTESLTTAELVKEAQEHPETVYRLSPPYFAEHARHGHAREHGNVHAPISCTASSPAKPTTPEPLDDSDADMKLKQALKQNEILQAKLSQLMSPPAHVYGSDDIKPGWTCKIQGLQNQPELNGLRGEFVGEVYNQNKLTKRWQIKIPDGRLFGFKRANFTDISPPLDTAIPDEKRAAQLRKMNEALRMQEHQQEQIQRLVHAAAGRCPYQNEADYEVKMVNTAPQWVRKAPPTILGPPTTSPNPVNDSNTPCAGLLSPQPTVSTTEQGAPSETHNDKDAPTADPSVASGSTTSLAEPIMQALRLTARASRGNLYASVQEWKKGPSEVSIIDKICTYNQPCTKLTDKIGVPLELLAIEEFAKTIRPRITQTLCPNLCGAMIEPVMGNMLHTTESETYKDLHHANLSEACNSFTLCNTCFGNEGTTPMIQAAWGIGYRPHAKNVCPLQTEVYAQAIKLLDTHLPVQPPIQKRPKIDPSQAEEIPPPGARMKTEINTEHRQTGGHDLYHKQQPNRSSDTPCRHGRQCTVRGCRFDHSRRG
jgi:hypothetical protein